MLRTGWMNPLWAAWVLALGGARPAAAADENAQLPNNPATARELKQIVVIGTTPLPGLGLSLDHIAGNVQTAGADDLKRQQSAGIADFLNAGFSGVNVNENQGNPFQPDVNYHGFTASPLLGTPEGLSVYVDGVRVNEAFGDTVNWDLIPEAAISNITLVAGSNPVFGLNTLGGALAVQTKSGHDDPGTELEGAGGSFGRKSAQFESGGEKAGFDYFLTGNVYDEDGWRDLSPSRLYQGFGKVGWENDRSDVDLSYSYAGTRLIGNGATPQSLLDARRKAIYTAPDTTRNQLHFFNLTGTHFLSDTLLLSGNAYHRRLTTRGNNGDVNDNNYLSEEYPGPDIDCTAAASSEADIAYCSNGINRASRLRQRTTGVGLQLTATNDLAGAKNQLVLGVNWDRSSNEYEQTFQYATLAPDRTAIPVADPFNSPMVVNALSGSNRIVGIYLTDTFSPTRLLHLTLSARYNRNTEVLDGTSVNTDLAEFGDGFGEASALVEDHTYSRLNPAIGLSFTPNDRLTWYANYNEASRAPTVIELGCSDPQKPCGLPNEFASDPYLDQVVARTVELGARGQSSGRTFNWSVDVFRTDNRRDIQFVATSTSEGYFTNVGGTRRQGFDLSLGGRRSSLTWHLVYSFIDATYRTGFDIASASNSSADADGIITVRPGARLPLIPRHAGRLSVDYAVSDRWEVGANVLAAAGSFLRGNENNANRAGGINGQGAEILGSGWTFGYATVNLRSTIHLGKRSELFVRLTNLFDRHHATAGFLTRNSFDPTAGFRANPDDWTHENSVSPAQPRALWMGVRWRLD